MVLEMQLQSFRISLVLTSFFFPVTSPEIFDSLKAREFEIGRSQANIPTGPRAYISGPIARKGDSVIDIDSNRKLVGVSGDSIKDSLQNFSDIINIIKEDFNVNLDEELDYVELIASYLVISKRNPFEVLQNSTEVKFKEKLQEILKTETSQYRFSLVPKGVLPSSRKWFEITVSPKLTMPTKAYWVEVIFRDRISHEVITFGKNLVSTLSRVINAIEDT